MGESGVGVEVSRVVDSVKELQERVTSLVSRISGKEYTLRQRALALDSTIRHLRSTLSSLVSDRSLDPIDAQKIEEELCKASYIMTEGDTPSFLPNKFHGRFMRALLGPINVRAAKKDVQLKVKEEYNSFRDRTAFLFLSSQHCSCS